jgi:hypothetical protein
MAVLGIRIRILLFSHKCVERTEIMPASSAMQCGCGFALFYSLWPVLRIHEILVRIRIREFMYL